MTKAEFIEQMKDYPNDAKIVIVEVGGKCRVYEESRLMTFAGMNEIQLFPFRDN